MGQSEIKKTIVFKVIITIVVLLTGITSTCAGGQKLILGWEPWPPFQMKDSSGRYTGLDLDLIQLILSKTKYDIQFKEMPWKRQLVSIQQGKIDMLAGASKTNEREAYSLFSDAYRRETMVMYIRHGETKKYIFRQLKDLIGSGFRLGITRGYYYGETFSELSKTPVFINQLSIVTRDAQLYKMLLGKHIDGFLGDTVNVATNLRKEGLLNKVEIYPLPVYSSDIHVMFSKKSVSPEMVKAFNKSLADLKSAAIYRKILNKYQK